MSDCIIFQGHKDKNGYGKMKRGGKPIRAHRLAYQQAKGEIPEGMIVCHSCDNPSCINPEHLFIGTHKDNSDDKISKGRGGKSDQRREKNGNAKLTEQDVAEIKKLIQEGHNNVQIGKRYGVTHQAISSIRRKKLWVD